MAETSAKTCPACGARLPKGAKTCDLCGARVAPEEEPASSSESSPQPAVPANASDGIFCNACGWKNPPGANYCSRCGERLQETAATPPPAAPPESPSAPSASEEAASASQAGMGRQVAFIVGLAVLVVAGLFVITSLSDGGGDPALPPAAADETSPGGGGEAAAAGGGTLEAEPLTSPVADSARLLEEEIAQLEGEERRARQRALVDFLLRSNRVDHAALVQRDLAREANTAPAWRRAGDLLFGWMMVAEEEEKSVIAPQVIAAYERVLEDAPDDLDARANMAWAYQFDPERNPMQAIEMTNTILEEDPEHLQANLNRGLFLTRINRMEEAIAQFERVKEVAGEGTPAYEQAERYIQAVEDVEARGGTEEPRAPGR